MSLKILGVITEEKTERIEVSNKHIKIISNRLEKEKIPHLIIDDSTNGIGVILLDDVPSLLIHNDKKKQWEYMFKCMSEEEEVEPTIMETFVIHDNNKNVDILDFLKTLLKVCKDGGDEYDE